MTLYPQLMQKKFIFRFPSFCWLLLIYFQKKVPPYGDTHVPITPKRKSKTPLSEFFFPCSMMHKYSKNPWGQIPLLKFLSIYSREVFHKKSWVVVIFHFEKQSLVSSHPFCIRDREMRFSPLFCKLNVVINGSKFQQNRPIQSRDIAWNVRSKIKFKPNSFYSCLFYHARE